MNLRVLVSGIPIKFTSISSSYPNTKTGVNTLDFITVPGDSECIAKFQAGDIEAPQTAIFGFVDFNIPNSMIKLSQNESLRPLLATALLSFVVGLAYGFLSTLNCQYQQRAKMPVQKMVVLHSSYFWYVSLRLTSQVIVLTSSGATLYHHSLSVYKS